MATNRERAGYHVHLVTGGAHPRFAYTMGLRASVGAELILPGCVFYMADEIQRIIVSVRERLLAGSSSGVTFTLEGLGSFTLRRAHATWTESLMLSALEYEGVAEIAAFQLFPDAAHWTLDVPDMRLPWSAQAEPVWRWLHEPWPYEIPSHTTVLTNLAALRGQRITAVSHWDGDEWEMFAGSPSDVEPAEARVVPLGTLLGADPSLAPALELGVGRGLWRDTAGGEWLPWGCGPVPAR